MCRYSYRYKCSGLTCGKPRLQLPRQRPYVSNVLAIPLLIQFLKCPGKAAEDVTTPCTLVGDLEKFPDSWLGSSPTLANAAIWGVNQWIKDLCFSFSL